MKIKVQLTWTDYLNASLLHMRPSPVVRIIQYGVLAFTGLVILAALFLSITGELDFSLDSFLVIFVILSISPLYRYAYLPWRIRQIFTQQKMLHSPFEFEFTDDGMFSSSEFGTANMPWGTFVRWKEDRNLLILYHSDVMFNIMPKRFFSDPQQLEIFKSYLVKNNIPTRKPFSRVGCVLYFVLVIVMGVACYMSYSSAASF